MTLPDEDDLTAAELALGLLHGDERAAALRRQLREPAFAEAVVAWHARLGTMFAGWPESAPPTDGEDRLLAALAPKPDKAVRRWQALSAVATALAASLLLVVLLRPAPLPVKPTSVAVTAEPSFLAALTGASVVPLAAAYDGHSHELRIPAATLSPAGKSAQLWMIVGKNAPQPLALLPNGSGTRMVMPEPMRGLLREGVVLAVSIEPVGGSPTGLPTGPVVASGAFSTA